MKILFITPRIPFPPIKGDQAVAYHRLQVLGQKHDITLLTFVDGDNIVEAEAALRPFCSRIIKIPHPRWKIIWNLLSRSMWSKLPLQVIYYHSVEFQKAIDKLLLEDFDLIHAFMLRLLPYLEERENPVLLECIDSMQLNMSRQIEITTGLKRWIFKHELCRLKRYEPKVDNYVKCAIFVSPIDVVASGLRKAWALPLGVKVPDFAEPCMRPIVAFSGNMRYPPNIQAVEWFVRNCWPDIQQAIPDATFRIIGGDPGSSILAMKAILGVEVVGRVKDMMQALQNVAISVAPMQSGSGMQYKVLEAMACGLPVVVTSLGLGAINAQRDRDIYVEDNPNKFTQIVVMLLKEERLRAKIGSDAKKYIQAHHSWDRIGEEFERNLEKIIMNENDSG